MPKAASILEFCGGWAGHGRRWRRSGAGARTQSLDDRVPHLRGFVVDQRRRDWGRARVGAGTFLLAGYARLVTTQPIVGIIDLVRHLPAAGVQVEIDTGPCQTRIRPVGAQAEHLLMHTLFLPSHQHFLRLHAAGL